MKRLSLFALVIFASAPLSLSAQKTKPAQKIAMKYAVKSNARLDVAVATVGNRKITRRNVIFAYAESDPRVLGSFLLERYATLQTEMQVSLADLGDQVLTRFPDRFEGIVQELMATAAIEEAAQKKGITLTEAEVTASVHESLEARRKAAELPPASDP